MTPKTSPSIAAMLLILGGAVFGVLGGIHASYTLLDMRSPRRLVPVDPAVAQAMANSALRLSRGGTDMWRAWIGFNFSHSLGLLLVSALGLWAGCRIKMLPVGVISLVLTLIGCAYECWPCSTGFGFLRLALPLAQFALPPRGCCRCRESPRTIFWHRQRSVGGQSVFFAGNPGKSPCYNSLFSVA